MTKPETPTEPEPFNQHETDRVHYIAELYAKACRAQGRPVPPDPFRALLCAAESMLNTITAMHALHERAQHQCEGGQEH